MAGFNGDGTFSRVHTWVTDKNNGVKITASRMDSDSDNFALGFENCVTRDGQSPATANLPMGGFKHTNITDASANTEYLSYAQLRSVGSAFLGTATVVSATNYYLTVAPTVAVASQPVGSRFAMSTLGNISTSGFTSTTTLVVSSATAMPVRSMYGLSIARGEIPFRTWMDVQVTQDFYFNDQAYYLRNPLPFQMRNLYLKMTFAGNSAPTLDEYWPAPPTTELDTPVITNTSTGLYTITFPATTSLYLGWPNYFQSINFAGRAPVPTLTQGAGALGLTRTAQFIRNVSFTTPTTGTSYISVYTQDLSGTSANLATGSTLYLVL